MKALKDFREFILRGNVVDLAVGIVIGAAFSGIVTAFVKDLITPLIGIFGKFSFPSWTVTVNKSVFQLGDFINTLISFLIISAVIFFLVVRPINALVKRVYHEKAADPDTRECPFCYSKIPLKATRCGFCTSEVEAVAVVAAVVATNLQLPKL
ncbi:MAG TPA: large conductance mechanosensitive channel protein MscL [Ktedonobacterales bacterium]